MPAPSPSRCFALDATSSARIAALQMSCYARLGLARFFILIFGRCRSAQMPEPYARSRSAQALAVLAPVPQQALSSLADLLAQGHLLVHRHACDAITAR